MEIDKPKPKYATALLWFIERRETGLFELEAFNLYGDTCLHTTVSDLRKRGMEFRKEPQPHRHRNGGSVCFTRYFLTSQNAAESLLRRGGYL